MGISRGGVEEVMGKRGKEYAILKEEGYGGAPIQKEYTIRKACLCFPEPELQGLRLLVESVKFHEDTVDKK